MTRKHKSGILFRMLLLAIATTMVLLPLVVTPILAALPSHTIKIGILEDTSGGAAQTGLTEQRGAEEAIQQANVILAAGTTGLQFTYTGFTVDTTSTTSGANQGYVHLVDDLGVQVIVGPCCSFGVQGIQSSAGTFSDSSGRHVPIISPSSTAAAFSIPNDYIFRDVGPDTVQGLADAKWVCGQGVQYVGIIARHDPYGDGIRIRFNDTYVTGCPGVTNSHIRTEIYAKDIPSGWPTAEAALETDVHDLLIAAGCGAPPACTAAQFAKVGVYAVAFEDDGSAIYNAANTGTYAHLVHWYGTDGDDDNYFYPASTQAADGGSVSNSMAAFLASVNYTGTNPVGPSPGAGQASMETLFTSGTTVPKNGGGTINLAAKGFNTLFGGAPGPYSDYAYDAAVLAMLGILQCNCYTGAGIAQNAFTPATLTNQVGSKAIGATGLLSLNGDGDRAQQDYVIWWYQSVGGGKYNFTDSSCACGSGFAWDVNANAGAGGIVKFSALTQLSETGGTIWTTVLQNLAPTVTFTSVPVFPSAIIALSTLLLATTATFLLIRKRRI